MNIYKSLNELILYIEENLDQNIETKTLAKMIGVNVQTLQSIFVLLTNIGISEYIRNRRMTNAFLDLQSGMTVMEVAVKYQYTSATAFSRSFLKFHGIKPSEVKKNKSKMKNYPILNFDEDNKSIMDMSYRIEKRESFTIYGVKKETNEENISYDAPRFWSEIQKKYKEEYGSIHYGMVLYEKRFESDKLEYWCLYNEKHKDLIEVSFPASKWLIFKIYSREARDIQNLSYKFYNSFFPKNKYRLRDLPELEVYEDNFTEFMIAIE